MTEIAILVVEDDNTLREVLAYNLRKEGYRVLEAADGAKALEIYRSSPVTLVILDIMLPLLNGLEVCRIIHSENKVPVIMLTAKSEEIDKVVGLELGADDYVTKPFSMRELLARIKALLRRVEAEGEKTSRQVGRFLEGGAIKIDLLKHTLLHNNEPVELNPKEFELLVFLMRNIGQVISREQLLSKIWGYDYIGNARTVDVHIRWLRQKIEDDAEKPVHLITVRGYGYKFEA